MPLLVFPPPTHPFGLEPRELRRTRYFSVRLLYVLSRHPFATARKSPEGREYMGTRIAIAFFFAQVPSSHPSLTNRATAGIGVGSTFEPNQSICH